MLVLKINISPNLGLAYIAAVLEKEGFDVSVIDAVADNLSFDIPVKKIMSSPLITINHDEPISSAAKIMSSKKIRKLAVSENGKIIGIITSTDLVTKLQNT